MAVTVQHRESGQTFTGKFATCSAGKVSLWSGIMADKKGGWRGCGKKLGVFPEADVTVAADEPDREVRRA
ncbi:MAG: hypothetical protein HY689_15135 [Chloroflexi bacterium]|nr:hypothetical protein [Chloroflexota bacterium]